MSSIMLGIVIGSTLGGIIAICICVLIYMLFPVIKKGLAKIVHETKQFFRPFPEPESWSYRIHTWWYDLREGGHITENINIDPSKSFKLDDIVFERSPQLSFILTRDELDALGSDDAVKKFTEEKAEKMAAEKGLRVRYILTNWDFMSTNLKFLVVTEPSGEAVSNDGTAENNVSDILDIPAYIRRDAARHDVRIDSGADEVADNNGDDPSYVKPNDPDDV